MEIKWIVTEDDIRNVLEFFGAHRENPWVSDREKRNLGWTGDEVSKEQFWQELVTCLLTTQQRSGPDSPVCRFANTKPFPLSYSACESSGDVEAFAVDELTRFGGLRRHKSIAHEVAVNFDVMERGLWQETSEKIRQLGEKRDAAAEREVADFIDDRYLGFGPKQSRNLLQALGLTLYEIPIDSRVTKWLNEFGFPVAISATMLSDRDYYHFVLDGFQHLCERAGVYPCLLDGAIFASHDPGKWTADKVGW